MDHFQLKHEIEDQQFDQNIVEHFEIYMVLINPIFEEKIPKVYILSQENLIWKTPRLKKKKVYMHLTYLTKDLRNISFIYEKINLVYASFMASITCMFAAFSSAWLTHIYLLGRNKSCMNYTNEMMHVQMVKVK